MQTDETKANTDKRNGDNSKAAADPPKEPTASEISRAVSKLVAELEHWPASAQRRVLSATATTLGIQNQPEKSNQQRQSNSGGGSGNRR